MTLFNQPQYDDRDEGLGDASDAKQHALGQAFLGHQVRQTGRANPFDAATLGYCGDNARNPFRYSRVQEWSKAGCCAALVHGVRVPLIGSPMYSPSTLCWPRNP